MRGFAMTRAIDVTGTASGVAIEFLKLLRAALVAATTTAQNASTVNYLKTARALFSFDLALTVFSKALPKIARGFIRI